MGLKLIREDVDNHSVEILTESDDKGKKSYSITGPFIQSEIRNKNGRIYRRPLIEREVSKLNSTKIKNGQLYGEMDHPPTPTISLQKASHLITELNMVGNNGIGKAKILDTPMGRIATSILDAGGQLMVSTRGLGTLGSDNYVNEDFDLITVDIVADGSAPDSYVNGILENKEYVIENNIIVERAVENLQEKVDDKYDSDYAKLVFKEFINEIKQNLK